jgi:murein peptide amidase A
MKPRALLFVACMVCMATVAFSPARAAQDEPTETLLRPAQAERASGVVSPLRRVALRRVRLGRSSRGRPIWALELSGRDTRRGAILVVGCIHGNECAGIRVTRLLASLRRKGRSAVWLVHDLNPDGRALGSRQNARGVDLNRNFPAGWRARGKPWDPYYPGRRPLSEPETRAIARLILRIRPETTIWFHQPQGLVRAWGKSITAARRYAQLSGEPFRARRWPPGSATRWQNRRFAGASSFVVELPPGPLARAAALRHAFAVLALAGSFDPIN